MAPTTGRPIVCRACGRRSCGIPLSYVLSGSPTVTPRPPGAEDSSPAGQLSQGDMASVRHGALRRIADMPAFAAPRSSCCGTGWPATNRSGNPPSDSSAVSRQTWRAASGDRTASARWSTRSSSPSTRVIAGPIAGRQVTDPAGSSGSNNVCHRPRAACVSRVLMTSSTASRTARRPPRHSIQHASSFREVSRRG